MDGGSERPSRDAKLAPFSGYHARDIPQEDVELTHVGPATSCGEYLRRFWHPIVLSAELKDLPLPLRIMGEDLVAFRTHAGEIALLHRHCSHRGTSLEFGRITERGIQCCYHGWHFAPDGRVLETPGESEKNSRRIASTICHGAYPTIEYKGLIFGFMGPPEDKPEFPVYDTFEASDTEYAPVSFHFPCNWLQIHENCMDPFHATWLHGRHNKIQLTPAWAATPIMEWRPTPLGMTCASTRRAGDNIWISQVDCVLPNLRQTGFWEDGVTPKSFARSALSVWIVPIDDVNSTMIGFRIFNEKNDPNGQGRKEVCGKETADVPGQSGGRPYAEQQRDPNDWEANSSQRPIAIHKKEHLATTDRGVAMLRKMIRKSIRESGAGGSIDRPKSAADGTIPTYVQDTVLPIPPISGRDDQELMAEVGKAVVDAIFDEDSFYRSDREAIIEETHFGVAARLAEG